MYVYIPCGGVPEEGKYKILIFGENVEEKVF